MLTKNLEIRKQALAEWLKGRTFTNIARDTGVSRQRIHELLVPPTVKRKAVYAMAGGQCEDCGVHLGNNGHYHSEPTGPIDDFVQPMKLLCLACHRIAHEGGDL